MVESLYAAQEASYAPLHLRDYWHVLLRRRWLMAFVAVVVAGAGIARIFVVRPLYQATAEILIDRNTPRFSTSSNSRASTRLGRTSTRRIIACFRGAYSPARSSASSGSAQTRSSLPGTDPPRLPRKIGRSMRSWGASGSIP